LIFEMENKKNLIADKNIKNKKKIKELNEIKE
jgi:hypothetical protein